MTNVNWQLIPGPPGKDIGVGAWGAVWLVHLRNDGNGGQEGFVSTRKGQGWSIAQRSTFDSRASRIAVAPNGQAWAIFSSGPATGVFVYAAGLDAAVPFAGGLGLLQLRAVYSPTHLPTVFPGEDPIDIAAGGLDTAYVVIQPPSPINQGTLRLWDGQQWESTGIPARRIAVEPNGTLWRVESDFLVYRDDGTSGVSKVGGPPPAEDIGVGANGKAWIVSGGNVYFWDGFTWEQAGSDRMTFHASAVAVSPEGTPWVLDQFGNIFTIP